MTTTQMKDMVSLRFRMIIVCGVFILTGTPLFAQSGATGIYKGFTGSFGSRSILVSSDIAELQGTRLTESGGQLGFVYGNAIVRSRVNVFGYYGSSGNTPGTTTLYTSNAAFQFYPAQLFHKKAYRLQPYVSAGIAYDRFKFFGFYINREPGVTNYSQAEAPYLGKLKQINAMAGTGLELSLKDEYDFIHLFTEIKYIHNVSATTDHEAFSQTDLLNKMQFVVGISFGAIR